MTKTYDSKYSVERAGGEDPNRYTAHIIEERKIKDHDKSGLNANATARQPEYNGNRNAQWMAAQDKKVAAMGYPNVDGTYNY
jgi:hypothetical protein